jgi:phenylalanyl-tRNA synthetase beta chain
MHISYNWLKDLADIKMTPETLAQKLTFAGHAVEGIEAFNDDYIFDIDLTSNRPDCLSHLGICREIAALQNFSLTNRNENGPPAKFNSKLSVSISDPDLCGRFTARVARGIKIGPSPEWLVKRLESVGERSINNVADITNFVMHELGQPMHAFDLAELAGGRIDVRRALDGETIKTLDGVERRLDQTMLAVCDAEKPAAVAGIMGGLESSIAPDTTDILLEVAFFSRENVRQTSRKLGLATEASYRFERGVDIENLIRASNRAGELICELAGGELSEIIDVYPRPWAPAVIESKDPQRAVKRLTGLEIEQEEIERIFAALGIARKSDSLFVSPSWRYDLAIEEDLVEEAARIYGYDKIADEIPPVASAGEYQPGEKIRNRMRAGLTALGFNETLSYSFIDAANDQKFETVPGLVHENLAEPFVTLRDSVIENSVRMRPSLIPGLLSAVRTNLNHQRRDLKLFEIGTVFSASGADNNLPNERRLLALALTGNELLQNRAMGVREFDFYDLTGALDSAVGAAGISPLEYSPADSKHLRKGQSASAISDGKTIGFAGRVADDLAASYKFRVPVYVCEVDLDALLAAGSEKLLYRPLAQYPSVSRDVSLLIDRSTTFSAVKQVISAGCFDLVNSVDFVDVYEGPGVAAGARSLTIRIEYRSDVRTLTEEEVEAVHKAVIETLARNFGTAGVA